VKPSKINIVRGFYPGFCGNLCIENKGVVWVRSLKEKGGPQEIANKAGMYLKTKDEKIGREVNPTMLLKTRMLYP
jgi:hypothetical protein